MKSISKINAFFFFLSLCVATYPYGFSRGTLVKLASGYTPIELVCAGDEIISSDDRSNSITKVIVYVSNNCVQLIFHKEVIVVDKAQQLYCTRTNSWRSIQELLDAHELYILLERLIDCVPAPPTVLFDLVVEPDHCFCVTTQDIVVHNFVECAAIPVVTLSMCTPTMAVVAPMVIPVGVGLAVLWSVGKSIWQHFNEQHQEKELQQSYETDQQNIGGGTPDPDDPDKDFFRHLKNRSDKIARSKRFGKMYHDPITDRWWSKDRAGHGGSCYKVFKKVAKGFEWVCDAASDGTEIMGKHKGPTGLFIPSKEVYFL